jgi:hypothetical protein
MHQPVKQPGHSLHSDFQKPQPVSLTLNLTFADLR